MPVYRRGNRIRVVLPKEHKEYIGKILHVKTHEDHTVIKFMPDDRFQTLSFLVDTRYAHVYQIKDETKTS